MIKAVDDYKVWSMSPLNYNFNHIFICISVIYILSTLFDFCLTFITFRLNPDGFFANEISVIIKNALSGEPVSYVLIIVLIMSPLITVYGLNVYLEKRYGCHVCEMKICYVFICCVSFIHVYGGWLNFVHLINL